MCMWSQRIFLKLQKLFITCLAIEVHWFSGPPVIQPTLNAGECVCLYSLDWACFVDILLNNYIFFFQQQFHKLVVQPSPQFYFSRNQISVPFLLPPVYGELLFFFNSQEMQGCLMTVLPFILTYCTFTLSHDFKSQQRGRVF